MKRDIKDFVSQKPRSKYYTVNNLSEFLDAQNANLFVMYVKARFQIKFEQTKSYIFYLIISSGTMFYGNYL
jgi:predicted cation transporter